MNDALMEESSPEAIRAAIDFNRWYAQADHHAIREHRSKLFASLSSAA